MSAISVDVAEAVKDMLDAGTFSQEIAPERSYADWELELEDADTLHVDVAVVSTELKVELASRGSYAYIVPVDVCVRKRFTADVQNDDTGRIPNEQIDSLVLLVQEIHELFSPNRLTTFSGGVWQETKLMANPVREHLHKMRQFTGYLRVTFRADKAIV